MILIFFFVEQFIYTVGNQAMVQLTSLVMEVRDSIKILTSMVHNMEKTGGASVDDLDLPLTRERKVSFAYN